MDASMICAMNWIKMRENCGIRHPHSFVEVYDKLILVASYCGVEQTKQHFKVPRLYY